jgi:hypothetical protein
LKSLPVESASDPVPALTQPEFESLNAVSKRRDILGVHKDKLARLGLIELKSNGWAVTELGQTRLTRGI